MNKTTQTKKSYSSFLFFLPFSAYFLCLRFSCSTLGLQFSIFVVQKSFSLFVNDKMGQVTSSAAGKRAVLPSCGDERTGNYTHSRAKAQKKPSCCEQLGRSKASSGMSSGSVVEKVSSTMTGLIMSSIVRTPCISAGSLPASSGRRESTSSESSADEIKFIRQLAQVSLPKRKRISAWIDDVLEKSKYKILSCDDPGLHASSSKLASRILSTRCKESKAFHEPSGDLASEPSTAFLFNKRIQLDIQSVPVPVLATDREAAEAWKVIEASGDTWDIEDEKEAIKGQIHAIDLDSPKDSFLLSGKGTKREKINCSCDC